MVGQGIFGHLNTSNILIIFFYISDLKSPIQISLGRLGSPATYILRMLKELESLARTWTRLFLHKGKMSFRPDTVFLPCFGASLFQCQIISDFSDNTAPSLMGQFFCLLESG